MGLTRGISDSYLNLINKNKQLVKLASNLKDVALIGCVSDFKYKDKTAYFHLYKEDEKDLLYLNIIPKVLLMKVVQEGKEIEYVDVPIEGSPMDVAKKIIEILKKK